MFYNSEMQVKVLEQAIEVMVQTPNMLGRLFRMTPKWSASAPLSLVEMVKKISWKGGGATTSSVIRVNHRWVLDDEESIAGPLWLKVFRRKDGQKVLHVYSNTEGNLRVDAFDAKGERVSRMLIYPNGGLRYLDGAVPPDPDKGLEIKCD